MQSIIATGGAGFIESAVVRRLVADGRWRVVTIDASTYAGSRASLAELEGSARHAFVRGDDREAVFPGAPSAKRDLAVVLAAAGGPRLASLSRTERTPAGVRLPRAIA